MGPQVHDPSSVTAFLFSDIEGSTRLWEEDPERMRAALARHVYLGTAPILPWFTVLSSLISVVVIRIVVVTALGYGLSKYALEMVVRVLVLEMIPLTSAIFVALRCAIPNAAEVAGMRPPGGFAALTEAGADALRREVLPRVVAACSPC